MSDSQYLSNLNRISGLQLDRSFMLMKMPLNAFHLVRIRPWPLIAAGAGFNVAIGLICFLHLKIVRGIFLSIIIIGTVMLTWWRDIIREASTMGAHMIRVRHGLELGMILFITSEVIFFVAFFWAFFHRRLAPSSEIGCLWPPMGISALNPFSIPLLNTAVLLASGATVTWAHHGLLNDYKCHLSWGLGTTVFLGVYFTFLQLTEYYRSSFAIRDSVYGATFFVATGFHGLHVLIGTTFLRVCWYRARQEQFNSARHFGLEAAAWYWHFVDVVWIFLFIRIYWWAAI